MRRCQVYAVCLFVLGTPLAVHAYDWKTYNGHRYALTSTFGIWADMESEAVFAGGHLAAINDAAENEWLAITLENAYCRNHDGDPQFNIAWIGAYRESTSQPWQWASGEPVTYTDFLDEFGIGTHAYLHLFHWQYSSTPFTWRDNPLHDDPGSYGEHPRGIIEVVPEPATLVLLALGVLGVVRKPRSSQSRSSEIITSPGGWK